MEAKIFFLLLVFIAGSYARSCRKTCYRTQRYTYGCGTWSWNRCYGYRRYSYSCYYPCPVNGGWSGWSSYNKVTDCSVTCGNGEYKARRTRTCTNPRPSYGGRGCSGLSSETSTFTCTMAPCPIHGEWSDWKEWTPITECPVLCGGAQTDFHRLRSCSDPKYGGKPCEGEDREVRERHDCNVEPCGDKCPADRPTSIRHSDPVKFYECRDNKAILTECPAHATFNPLAETCVHTPCNIMDGLLQLDTIDSGRYVMCLAGSMVIELLCPSGTEFDDSTKMCV